MVVNIFNMRKFPANLITLFFSVLAFGGGFSFVNADTYSQDPTPPGDFEVVISDVFIDSVDLVTTCATGYWRIGFWDGASTYVYSDDEPVETNPAYFYSVFDFSYSETNFPVYQVIAECSDSTSISSLLFDDFNLLFSFTPTTTPPDPPDPPEPTPLPPPIPGALITRTATTTCETTASSSMCITEYKPEFYYHDWIFVNMIQIFLLSFMVIGYFMNRTLKQ